MLSFDEKALMCLKNIIDFANIINEIPNFNDIYKCSLDYCKVGMFFDELYSYIHSKRQSPHLVKNFFLGLCEKYPQGFNDCFLIARNKKSF